MQEALHVVVGAEQVDDVLPVLLGQIFHVAALTGLLLQIVLIVAIHLSSVMG